MKNKKSIACISAIMIFIFHLWVPVFSKGILFDIEKYIRYISYIGVDIFFFISAYSLANKKIEYKTFIKNRFVNIYLKFIIFLIIMSIYKGYNLTKFISILFGYELITKGGGSFLWFIPAIMILYLFIPLYKKIDDQYKIITPIVLTITWLLFTILVSIKTNYNAIFIFTNRIPIFMIGYYLSKYKIIDHIKLRKSYVIYILILLIVGSYISYNGYITHIKLDCIYDVFYIINIPLILGMILLVDFISSNKFINIIGTTSLEMYAFQMIFGFKLVNRLYILFNNSILTNILTFIILLTFSYLFNFIFKKVHVKKIIKDKN